ncbi:MAG TPA: DUF1801 domain-containing protein [Sphingobium sp.]
MAEIKTKAHQRTVADYMATVTHPVRRADAETLIPIMERISGEQATMWGPSIIGFGRYHYRYESGHEGDMCRMGFSPRSGSLVFYLAPYRRHEDLLARLGKHRLGKGCLYVNKLADVDMAVLEALIADAWDAMRERYPA